MNITVRKHFTVALSDDEQFTVDEGSDSVWSGRVNRLEFSTNNRGEVINVFVSGKRLLKNGTTNAQAFSTVIWRSHHNDFSHYPMIQKAVNHALRGE